VAASITGNKSQQDKGVNSPDKPDGRKKLISRFQGSFWLFYLGKFYKALAPERRSDEIMTSRDDDVFRRGLASLQAGQVANAEQSFKKLLSAQPRHIGGLNLLAISLIQLGRIEEAEEYLRRALRESATSDATFYNYGIVLKTLNRPGEALERFGQALAINPTAAATWNNRGTVFNELRRYQEAIADFDEVLRLDPNYAEALCNKAKSLAALKRHEQALAACEQAAALKPALAEAWQGRGNVLIELKQYQNALASYDKAIALNPAQPDAWIGLGNAFYSMQQFDAASKSYDKALSLRPDFADAWLGCGNVFYERNQLSEALAAYRKVVELRPDLPDGWVAQGTIFSRMRNYADAALAYDRAFAIDPNFNYLAGTRIHAKQQICDWTNLDRDLSHLLSEVRKGKLASIPFNLLATTASPADQLQCAKSYVADRQSFPAIWRGEAYTHDRIRVAYISSDYREHPIAYLIAEVLELHDRTKVETIGISLGPDDCSEIRTRMVKSFDQFHDARALSDDEAAALVRRLEIDIAVDLNNYTELSRPGILARRPAPVQASYLGVPSTMGADFIDYAIADRFVLSDAQQSWWTEKIVRMPDSYLAHDTVTKRNMPALTPTRAQTGLPEQGFVFCCFNNSFKITEPVFDVWMRLLAAVEGSVAWLSPASEPTRSNLVAQAKRIGVDPARLIFAPRVDRVEDHLSRHRAADLFLDTLPYNAHTTAADALWAGLPVVTCAGETFPARVAGSLLHAVGLPELVTHSLDDYETLALRLARDPVRLAEVKSKLALNRDTHPLFDTKRFTRHLEAAYVTMIERHRRQQPPVPFAVSPIV
jgi:predicted O-linked N-acetylglucosamine transferase (SPINDLY family)